MKESVFGAGMNTVSCPHDLWYFSHWYMHQGLAMPSSTPLAVLKKVAFGAGNLWHFLSTSYGQLGNGDPSPKSDLLLPPFTDSVDCDGQVRACRLADADDKRGWEEAMGVVQRQVAFLGGPKLSWRGVNKAVVVEGTPVVDRKNIRCSRQGEPPPAKASSRNTGSAKVSC